MGNTMVKSQLQEVKSFLSNTVNELTNFLNEVTLSGLIHEKTGEEEYYKLILSNMRKLLVYCEEGLDACSVILKSDPFQKSVAEKTLYKIYHQCIEEFFSPKNDAWHEDSRSAYTGRNSLVFQQEIPISIINALKSLEAEFQRIREELEYYETDYRTKMMQSK